ncbi:hypothetical protein ACYPKM_02100 [Pseudomonas aeruginosa]
MENFFLVVAYFFVLPFVGSYQTNPTEFWTFVLVIAVIFTLLMVVIYLKFWKKAQV